MKNLSETNANIFPFELLLGNLGKSKMVKKPSMQFIDFFGAKLASLQSTPKISGNNHLVNILNYVNESEEITNNSGNKVEVKSDATNFINSLVNNKQKNYSTAALNTKTELKKSISGEINNSESEEREVLPYAKVISNQSAEVTKNNTIKPNSLFKTNKLVTQDNEVTITSTIKKANTIDIKVESTSKDGIRQVGNIKASPEKNSALKQNSDKLNLDKNTSAKNTVLASNLKSVSAENSKNEIQVKNETKTNNKLTGDFKTDQQISPKTNPEFSKNIKATESNSIQASSKSIPTKTIVSEIKNGSVKTVLSKNEKIIQANVKNNQSNNSNEKVINSEINANSKSNQKMDAELTDKIKQINVENSVFLKNENTTKISQDATTQDINKVAEKPGSQTAAKSKLYHTPSLKTERNESLGFGQKAQNNTDSNVQIKNEEQYVDIDTKNDSLIEKAGQNENMVKFKRAIPSLGIQNQDIPDQSIHNKVSEKNLKVSPEFNETNIKSVKNQTTVEQVNVPNSTARDTQPSENTESAKIHTEVPFSASSIPTPTANSVVNTLFSNNQSILAQITQFIEVAKLSKSNVTKFEIELGKNEKYEIQFTKQSEGHSAKIVVGTETILNSIEKMLPELKIQLENRGIQFVSLDVEMNNFTQEHTKHESQGMTNKNQKYTTRINNSDKQIIDQISATRDFGYNTIEILA